MKQILFFRPQDFTDFHVKKGATHPDSERTLMVTFYLEENVAIVGLDSSVDKSKLEEILFNEESKDVFIVKGSGGDFFVSKNGVMDFNLHNGWILNEKIVIEFSEPVQVLNPELKLTQEVKLEPEIFPKSKPKQEKPKMQKTTQSTTIKTSVTNKLFDFRFWIIIFVLIFIFIDKFVFDRLESKSLLEQFVLICIFSLQCWVFIQSFKDIDFLRNLFIVDVDRVFMKDGYLIIEKADNLSYSKVHLKIIERLNKYLKNNAGASNDYGILKQIVELEVNSANEKAQSLLSFPLYLGLAGTFLGIIIGLSSFSSKSSSFFGSSSL
jgi:hypothetical protein